MQDGLPNELRIDAAEGLKAKRKGLLAVASVLIELSRILNTKLEGADKSS
jgi:hypothetical protein